MKTIYLVSELDADPHCGSHPIEAYQSRERAEERAEEQYDLLVDEIKVKDA